MSSAPTRGPVMRPGDDRDFTEIFQRLDDIERVRVGGLQFHEGTYGPLNVGDWLNIETTDDAGIRLKWPDTGIFYAHDAAEQNYIAITGGTTGDVQIFAGTGGFNFQTPGPMGLGVKELVLITDSASISLDAKTAYSLIARDGDINMTVHGAGRKLTILDSGGNPKIQWTEGTNDLHIPTGGTIIADL